MGTIFMTKTINAEALFKMYQMLGRTPKGKVAVKISSGEPGGHRFLFPDLIAPLVREVQGTNVMNNLSVDCDCDSSPAAPTMQNMGILASLDPVALDQACVDLVYAAPDSKDLVERMESRHGIHILEQGEALGMGSRRYTLVNVDEAVTVSE